MKQIAVAVVYSYIHFNQPMWETLATQILLGRIYAFDHYFLFAILVPRDGWPFWLFRWFGGKSKFRGPMKMLCLLQVIFMKGLGGFFAIGHSATQERWPESISAEESQHHSAAFSSWSKREMFHKKNIYLPLFQDGNFDLFSFVVSNAITCFPFWCRFYGFFIRRNEKEKDGLCIIYAIWFFFLPSYYTRIVPENTPRLNIACLQLSV